MSSPPYGPGEPPPRHVGRWPVSTVPSWSSSHPALRALYGDQLIALAPWCRHGSDGAQVALGGYPKVCAITDNRLAPRRAPKGLPARGRGLPCDGRPLWSAGRSRRLRPIFLRLRRRSCLRGLHQRAEVTGGGRPYGDYAPWATSVDETAPGREQVPVLGHGRLR